MTDKEIASAISANSRWFIERRAWTLVDAARQYLATEGSAVARESYAAWRIFAAELDTYLAKRH